MSKLPFSKFALKKQDSIKTVKIGEFDIEVKQYLPVNEKLDLIARVLNGAHDENNFPNPIKIEVLGTLEIIMAYTNISFTEKQKEDVAKLYDLLDGNGVVDLIINAIPREEYKFVIDGIDKTIDAVYTYQNSVLGILESVKEDYSNLELDAMKIQKTLADPNNIALLKDVLTKMG